MKTLEELQNLRNERNGVGRLDAGDVLTTVKNIPSSAYKFASDTVTPFLEPVATAKSIYQLGNGIYNLFTEGEQPNEEIAKAMGQYFVDRYGSLEAIGRTIKEDPVGFLGDASIPFTLGATGANKAVQLAGKTNTVAGKVANQAQKAAYAVDPTTQMLNLAKLSASGGSKLLNATAGSLIRSGAGLGEGVLKTAYTAGKLGGDELAGLNRGMKAEKTLEEVSAPAKAYIEGMRKIQDEAKSAYKTEKGNLGLNEVKIDIGDVEKSLETSFNKFGKKNNSGEYIFNGPNVRKTHQQILSEFEIFKNNPEFHTLEGLDDFKKTIDDLMPSATDRSSSGAFVTDTVNKIKTQIIKTEPKYSKVLEDYAKFKGLERQLDKAIGKNQINEIQKITRNLQATTRNNAYTNYNMKKGYLDEVIDKGGLNDLPFELAGQQLDTFDPRGISKFMGGGLGIGAGAGIAAGTGLPAVAPVVAMGLLGAGATSPKFLGNVAKSAGIANRRVNQFVDKSGLGTLNEIMKPAYMPALRGSRLSESAGLNNETQRARRLEELRKLQSK